MYGLDAAAPHQDSWETCALVLQATNSIDSLFTSGCCFRLLSLVFKQLYVRHAHSRGVKATGEPVPCSTAEILEEMQPGWAQTPSSQCPHHTRRSLSCEPCAVPLPPHTAHHPIPSHPTPNSLQERKLLDWPGQCQPGPQPGAALVGGGCPCRAHLGSPCSSLSFSALADQSIFTVPLCPRFLGSCPLEQG